MLNAELKDYNNLNINEHNFVNRLKELGKDQITKGLIRHICIWARQKRNRRAGHWKSLLKSIIVVYRLPSSSYSTLPSIFRNLEKERRRFSGERARLRGANLMQFENALFNPPVRRSNVMGLVPPSSEQVSSNSSTMTTSTEEAIVKPCSPYIPSTFTAAQSSDSNRYVLPRVSKSCATLRRTITELEDEIKFLKATNKKLNSEVEKYRHLFAEFGGASRIKQTLKRKTEQANYCKYCGKIKLDYLRSIQPYRCKYCGRSYKDFTLYTRHMMRHRAKLHRYWYTSKSCLTKTALERDVTCSINDGTSCDIIERKYRYMLTEDKPTPGIFHVEVEEEDHVKPTPGILHVDEDHSYCAKRLFTCQ